MSRNSAGGMQWTDGSSATFMAWRPGEPSLIDGNGVVEDCVEVWRDGLWNDEPCSATKKFV